MCFCHSVDNLTLIIVKMSIKLIYSRRTRISDHTPRGKPQDCSKEISDFRVNRLQRWKKGHRWPKCAVHWMPIMEKPWSKKNTVMCKNKRRINIICPGSVTTNSDLVVTKTTPHCTTCKPSDNNSPWTKDYGWLLQRSKALLVCLH